MKSNDNGIEYEVDHTGTENLELCYSNITSDCDLIYNYIPEYLD